MWWGIKPVWGNPEDEAVESATGKRAALESRAAENLKGEREHLSVVA